MADGCGCGRTRHPSWEHALDALLEQLADRGGAFRIVPCPRRSGAFHVQRAAPIR